MENSVLGYFTMFLYNMFISLNYLTLVYHPFAHSKYAQVIASSNANIIKKLQKLVLNSQMER